MKAQAARQLLHAERDGLLHLLSWALMMAMDFYVAPICPVTKLSAQGSFCTPFSIIWRSAKKSLIKEPPRLIPFVFVFFFLLVLSREGGNDPCKPYPIVSFEGICRFIPNTQGHSPASFATTLPPRKGI